MAQRALFLSAPAVTGPLFVAMAPLRILPQEVGAIVLPVFGQQLYDNLDRLTDLNDAFRLQLAPYI